MAINTGSAMQYGMGMGGFDMRGSWKNYRTGEVINVRDTVMEDNQIFAVTNSGKTVSANYLSSFVKLDKPEPDQRPSQQRPPVRKTAPKAPAKKFIDSVDGNGTVTAGSFVDETPQPETSANVLTTPFKSVPLDELEAEVESLINPGTPRQFIPPVKSTPHNPAITTVLNKLGPKEMPKITIDVKWDSIPEGLMFLKNYLDVSDEDLTKAIIDKFIDRDEIIKTLTDKLTNIISKKLGVDEPIEPVTTTTTTTKGDTKKKSKS